MWSIPLVLVGALLWWFFRKRDAAAEAPAKFAKRPDGLDAADIQAADTQVATTPEQQWNQASQRAVRQAECGDWHAYSCTLQALGDQLCEEGSGLEAINIYCRAMFVQINGPVDGAPFTGNGFVTDRIYDRMIEFAGVAGLDTAGTRAKFMDAAAKIHRRPMPLNPAKAWEAISANRAQHADAERQRREARNAARLAAQED
jgi:hypothetical protein